MLERSTGDRNLTAALNTMAKRAEKAGLEHAHAYLLAKESGARIQPSGNEHIPALAQAVDKLLSQDQKRANKEAQVIYTSRRDRELSPGVFSLSGVNHQEASRRITEIHELLGVNESVIFRLDVSKPNGTIESTYDTAIRGIALREVRFPQEKFRVDPQTPPQLSLVRQDMLHPSALKT